MNTNNKLHSADQSEHLLPPVARSRTRQQLGLRRIGYILAAATAALGLTFSAARKTVEA
ncbi:hypothetical protein [Bifidobacterium tsurumiense]|uniref:hypothetical protein n=1 Tax=Bifidobacterium tsurumiense TaxID=356829 RepID=UPI0012B29C7C|nr:hypothetical protein [Bifidobacterium tsurumiense]MDY4678435.1 hypothetical protein [Bifidobacterium tsurumiense]